MPFPLTARDEVLPTDPRDEPLRPVPAPTYPEFIDRTRRYFRLTHKGAKLHYARGLDSKSGDFA